MNTKLDESKYEVVLERRIARRHSARSTMALPWLGALALGMCVFTAAAQEPAAPAQPIPANVEKFVVKTASPENAEVPFYVRRPARYTADQKELRRVLFLCPIYNGDGLNTLAKSGEFLALADQRGWFVIVPTFKNKGDTKNRDTCYYYPEKFSGKAVLEALEMIKKKYPIAMDGLLMQGYSGGAQFVHRFALWAPERVTAASVNSSSWFDEPKPPSAQVAWLVTVGDGDDAFDESLAFVSHLRNAGALPLFRSYAALTHGAAEGAGVKQLVIAFLSFYDELTRPKLGQPKPLRVTRIEQPLPAARMPFVGDTQEWRVYENTPEKSKEVSEDSRIYLPSEPIAKVWSQAEENEKE